LKELWEKVPQAGAALGFGFVGFVVAYFITTRWMHEDIPTDIGIGAIVAAVSWVFMIVTGKGPK
jgi:hypothetical protein